MLLGLSNYLSQPLQLFTPPDRKRIKMATSTTSTIDFITKCTDDNKADNKDVYEGIEAYMYLCNTPMVKARHSQLDQADVFSTAMGALMRAYEYYMENDLSGNIASYLRKAIQNDLYGLYRSKEYKNKNNIESLDFHSDRHDRVSDDLGSDAYDQLPINDKNQEDAIDTLLLLATVMEFAQELKAEGLEADYEIVLRRINCQDETLTQTVEALYDVPGVPKSQPGMSRRLKLLALKFKYFSEKATSAEYESI